MSKLVHSSSQIFLAYYVHEVTLSGPKSNICNCLERCLMLNGCVGFVGTKICVVLFFCQIILGPICCCCGSLLVINGQMVDVVADLFTFLGCHTLVV